ncbi:MAG: D-alanyl-D-alanine dipeptidase [Parachlamydiales bacterium]|nr:D-alanyl-D-alanine dipeptidase [Parachlamydiales bacterium]
MNDLVELIHISPNIRLDIRYATPNNFTGKVVYTSSRCFLLRKTAERLTRVQNNLEKRGLGLKVFDGYRPIAAQRIFWELVPDPRYVADPKEGSRHNRGASVDLTLIDANGVELLMPTEFDDFTEKASHSYQGGSPEALKNRELLKNAMVAEGFVPYPHEWWHYDDPDWQKHPLLDVSVPC